MGAHIASKILEIAPDRLRSLAVGGITRPTTEGWTTNDFDIQNLAGCSEKEMDGQYS